MWNQPTSAEDLLWRCLRARRCAGAKFSRQIPIGPFFVDFVCREHGLVVEVDGESHALTVDYDARRTGYLEAQGYRVIRFTNEDVMRNLDGVVRAIDVAVARPTPAASQPVPPASGSDFKKAIDLTSLPLAGGTGAQRQGGESR